MQKVFSLLIGVLLFTGAFAQKMTCVITSPPDSTMMQTGEIPVTVDVKNAKGEVKLSLAYYRFVDELTPIRVVKRDASSTFPYTMVWDVTWWEEGSVIRVTATDSKGNTAVSPARTINIR